MEKIISGKVREVYDVDQKQLVIVTTDRISAYDVILDSMIPHKGIALNLLSNFWFCYTEDIVPNHLITTDLAQMPEYFQQDVEYYQNRTVMVKKLKMLPYEFVVRGYLFGSMWSEYQATGSFSGRKLPAGCKQAERLEEPILTPSTKAATGHDLYIPFSQMELELGAELAHQVTEVALSLYKKCYEYALTKGIIIADTKFEFGLDEDGRLTLADEVLTPDSSRFWDSASYQVGTAPKSYDKQFVRDWLTQNHLNGVAHSGSLPQDIIDKTEQLYRSCCEMLTSERFF